MFSVNPLPLRERVAKPGEGNRRSAEAGSPRRRPPHPHPLSREGRGGMASGAGGGPRVRNPWLENSRPSWGGRKGLTRWRQPRMGRKTVAHRASRGKKSRVVPPSVSVLAPDGAKDGSPPREPWERPLPFSLSPCRGRRNGVRATRATSVAPCGALANGFVRVPRARALGYSQTALRA